MKDETGQIKVKRTRRRIYETPTPSTAQRPVVEIQPAFEGEGADVTGAAASKEVSADEIIRRHVMWAAGIGLIPIPLVDMAAVTTLQMKMLKGLSGLYEMEFSEQAAKSAVTSLASGVYAGLTAGSLTRLIPVIGFISMAAMPVINGALTYAVGKVFAQHFASGGTFLDFDSAKVRRYFEQQYKEGKKVASQVQDRQGKAD